MSLKILWFSPTPSLAEEFLNNVPMNGGFIKSLEREIQDKVDLSIAFYHNVAIPVFKFGKTTYYPIDSGSKTYFSKITNRILNKIEPENDLKKFIDVVNKVQPDLIHIHGTERPFGLIQQFSNIPAVISIQGNISVCELKFFSGIPKFEVFKYSHLMSWILFKTYIHEYRLLKKQAVREKIIYKKNQNFIGRTKWDKRLVTLLSPNASYFHNDEVLKDVFYSGEWNKKLGDILNLFTTCGPNIFKGIETILYCSYLLDQSCVQFHWKIAGVSKEDEIVYVAKKILKIKISQNLEFLGRLDDLHLKNNILNTNFYIAVSHIENSPNSLCEALLLGVPCIATNAGGTSTFIDEGYNGTLIQDGDPYAMAGAILELKNNYVLATNYGINARKKALLKHDKNKISKDLLEIYQEILNSQKNKEI
jgi:glycosyltransferase involved in cell wall biosynthesis